MERRNIFSFSTTRIAVVIVFHNFVPLKNDLDKSVFAIPCVGFSSAVGEHVAVGVIGGGFNRWCRLCRCVYLGVLVEGVAVVSLGTGISCWVVYVAFGGGEAVAYRVVAIAAVKVGCKVVCGVYHFTTGIVIKDICSCSAAENASHGGRKLAAGGIADAVKSSAGLGA